MSLVTLVNYGVLAYEWIYKPFFANSNVSAIMPIQVVLWPRMTQPIKEPIKESHEIEKNLQKIHFDILSIDEDHFKLPPPTKLKRRHSY